MWLKLGLSLWHICLAIIWWVIDKTIKQAEVLLHYWIRLVDRLKRKDVSLVLSQVLRPIVHYVVILVLVGITDLIWHHLTIVEVHLNCWEVIEGVHKIVALMRYESWVSIRKVGSMAKI